MPLLFIGRYTYLIRHPASLSLVNFKMCSSYWLYSFLQMSFIVYWSIPSSLNRCLPFYCCQLYIITNLHIPKVSVLFLITPTQFSSDVIFINWTVHLSLLDALYVLVWSTNPFICKESSWLVRFCPNVMIICWSVQSSLTRCPVYLSLLN